MKTLLSVVVCLMLSACSTIDAPASSEGLAVEASGRAASLAAEFPPEKPGPTTCEIKGEVVTCF